jgi:hypothetical protein
MKPWITDSSAPLDGEIPRGWVVVGTEDEEGLAEVIAFAHPINAERVVRAVNLRDEMVELLLAIKTDCEMALSGDWDKSDSGFQATLDAIDALKITEVQP